MIYPPQCLLCDERLEEEKQLCGACRADMPFNDGLSCDICGTPLLGTSRTTELCDRCHAYPPPWHRGRASLIYEGKTRQLLMQLKHGDQPDLARIAGQWLAKDVADIVTPETVLVPMPLHRRRLRERGYNQAQVMAKAMAERLDIAMAQEVLLRVKPTPPLGKLGRDERRAIMDGAIVVNPGQWLQERPILIVDDVMTTGASLSACTHALMQHGAQRVDVAVLARAAKAV